MNNSPRCTNRFQSQSNFQKDNPILKTPFDWLLKKILPARKNRGFEVAWYGRWNAQIERWFRAFLDLFGFLTPVFGKMRALVVPPLKPTFFHFLNPLYWLAWTFQFLGKWAITLPKQNWLLAAPAIATIIGLIVLAALITFRPQASRLEQYRLMMSQAVQLRDHKRAELVLGVLRKLDSDVNSVDYNSALILDDRGAHEEAVELMRKLAQNQSFAPASLWLLQHHYDVDTASQWIERDCEEFKSLAEIALLNDATRMDAHHLMGKFCNNRGDYQGALEHFKRLQTNDQGFALIIAKLHKDLGDSRSAFDTAKQFEKFVSDRLKRSPNTIAFRIQLAQALILQEREEAASQLLLDGYSYSQGQVQEYRLAAGEALVEKINRLDKSNSPSVLAQQIPLMRLSLSIAADSTKVTDSSNRLIKRVWQNKFDEQQTVRQALAAGVSPESMHLMSGLIMVLDQDSDRASIHLKVVRQTIKELPEMVAALALTWSEKTDWRERSLELLKYAQEFSPDDVKVRVTYGKILFKLNRYEEAAKELEEAARSLESAGIHETLADVYQSLNRKDQAAVHRDKAQQLRKSSAPSEDSKVRSGLTP